MSDTISDTAAPGAGAPILQSKRIRAIDWMRGLVMILMVLDHVSMAYDANHFSTDSAAMFTPGTALPVPGVQPWGPQRRTP